eukprot:9263263-Alexandrium_andersonii.AAC.1
MLSPVDAPAVPDQPEEEDLSKPAESVDGQAMGAQAEASCPKVPASGEESNQPDAAEVEDDMQPDSADIAEADEASSDESDSSS